MVKGITKYAVMITEPESAGYHLDKALFLANSGRPGPCWIDVPIDVQSSFIDERKLRKYDESEDSLKFDTDMISRSCREIVKKLQSSPRPVIMCGSGVRLAKAEGIFEQVIRKLGIPVTTAWTGHDLIDSGDPLFCGRPGFVGTRAGNFTVQNSETLLIMGSRLGIRQVSYNWKSFARSAFKIQVDVDPEEFKKPFVKIDMPVHSDLKLFLHEMDKWIDRLNYDGSRHKEWLDWCRERVRRYPAGSGQGRFISQSPIDPYNFYDILFRHLAEDDVVVCANGAASVMPFQVGSIRKGQRVFTNAGAASMGYELPAAIGAAVARNGGRVICLAGDGSMQLNLQELQTIVHHKLDIKIFVLNNGGYLSIRSSQKNFFGGNYVGESPDSGVSFPDVAKIAGAYGIPARTIDHKDSLSEIASILKVDGPVICEIMVDNDRGVEPKLSSKQLPNGRIVSPPLEDMYPFLNREEFLSNMLIPEWEADV
jgi:acetolactate synthase-1/2/3 large subunit